MRDNINQDYISVKTLLHFQGKVNCQKKFYICTIANFRPFFEQSRKKEYFRLKESSTEKISARKLKILITQEQQG